MSDNKEIAERAHKRQRIELESDAQSRDVASTTQQIIEVKDLPEAELYERLRKVLLCIVCLALPPPNECFQCSLGHLICEDCVTRLLAEGALKHNTKCPQCGSHLCWSKVAQNLAVEQILWELPQTCVNCEEQVDFKRMEHHAKVCSKRLVECPYRYLGCTWQGCYDSLAIHKASCQFPTMISDDVLRELLAQNNCETPSQSLHKCYRNLSAYRINFEDLELFRPGNRIQRWTVKFQIPTVNMFEETWQLLVNLPMSADAESYLYYGIKLLSTPRNPMDVSYFLTLPSRKVHAKQEFDIIMKALTYRFSFSDRCSGFNILPTICPMATYRLLAMPNIVVRLWMMLV